MAIKFTQTTPRTLETREKTYEVYDSKTTGFFIRIYASGKKKYMVEYARKRKETIGSVGVMTLDAARDEAIKLILLAKANGGTLPQHQPNQGKLTLKRFIDEHYESWMTQHKKNYAKDLSTIKSAFAGLMETELSKITYKQVDDLRTAWLESGNKPATVNRKTTALKGLFARAIEWSYASASPLEKMRDLSVDENINPRYLSPNEESRLYSQLDARESRLRTERESANAWRMNRGIPLLFDLNQVTFADHLKPMVITLLKTGMRRGELFNLKWKDVFLSDGYLSATDTKNGKSRHIPLHPELHKALKAWNVQPTPESYVFPGRSGGRMTDIKSAFNKLIEEAKITDFRLHDLRHTFASTLVMRGVPLNTVRQLLGHKDIKMTLRYAHLSKDNLANAINLL
ncbi:site-specific integrase [Pseudomonas sp. KK4]|uniref:site-specific integrase n=1 Tax=Pseudomonas sp. KK4 TaxID=1855729 RepID=UPI00097CBB4C|nr:site-specific integrase [Pseudomonas sp. KK4]